MMAFQAGGPARAGSRARSGRLRVGRAAPHAGEGAVGKAAGQERAASGWKSTFASCRAASGSSSAAARSRRGTAIPGLFASLATGNAVIVKPHPGAILPLAITVRIAREVLAEAGFDPNVVTLRRARRRRRHGADARAAARGQAHRLHRQHRQRRLARGERAAGAGLHRKGRRQPDHRRLGRRLQGRGAQRRVLAVALHRADVHGAAEHLHPEGRHRHRRRAT